MSKSFVIEDVVPLRDLLLRVAVGGAIDQCVLTVQKGTAVISAVDMTNTVFVNATEKLPFPDCVLGLCSMSGIIRVLEQKGEYTLSIEDGEQQSITLKKKGLGLAKFVLMSPEDVPTAVLDVTSGGKLRDQCKMKFVLHRTAMEKVNFLASVFPSGALRVVCKSDKVAFGSTEAEANRFQTAVGTCGGAEDFTTCVYTSMLLKALDIVFANGAESITIRTGQDKPVIVMQDNRNFWAVTPIVG